MYEANAVALWNVSAEMMRLWIWLSAVTVVSYLTRTGTRHTPFSFSAYIVHESRQYPNRRRAQRRIAQRMALGETPALLATS